MLEATMGASVTLGSFALGTLVWRRVQKLRASGEDKRAEARQQSAFMWSYLGERRSPGGDRTAMEAHEARGDIRGLPKAGFAWPAFVAAFGLRTLLILAAEGVVTGFSEFGLGVHVALNFLSIIPLALWLRRWQKLLWVSYDKPIKAAAAWVFILLVVGDTTLSVVVWLSRFG